jgi:hypothetical protein
VAGRETDETFTTKELHMAKQQPVHEIRLGSMKAAIWENRTDNGIRYNATLARIYKDGEQWKSTDSFGRDDLLLLAKVIDQAHSWIFTQGK